MLRMIQQLGGFVAGMLKMRQAGRAQEVVDQIGDAYGRFSGLSPTLIHALSEEDLVQLLRARGGLDRDRCWALAELLREEGHAYDVLGQEGESVPRFLKSMRLYLEVVDDGEDLPPLMNVSGLEDVIERVGDLDLAPGTRRKLVEFFEETGRFDRAENVVSWGLEFPDPDGAKRADAEAFYDRLSERTDDALETGGLSRAEVVEGVGRIRLMHAGEVPTS